MSLQQERPNVTERDYPTADCSLAVPARRRNRPRELASRWALVVALPLLALCCGCPLPQAADSTTTPSTTDTDASSSLAAPAAVILSSGDNAREFTGTIADANDVKVYALGRLAPGDHLVADVQRTGGNLDPILALFDDQEELIAFNDDRAADGSDLNPLLDLVVRGDRPNYYLTVAGYQGDQTAGTYSVAISVQRDVGVPAPEAQIVYLNWRGGSNIVIRNVGTYNLPAFSAADVGRPAEETLALKQRVQQIVEERYTAYNLTVLSSDDTDTPTAPHSTVYFGGRDLQAFAISEQIDTLNEDPNDNTIVFTQSYRGAFTRTPTFEQMGQALGNTVAHEIGHLLGLVHTADPNDLMDTTAYNERILTAQEFSKAAVDDSILPFGFQDAPDILTWILGLAGS
jgi:hypothetical protein